MLNEWYEKTYIFQCPETNLIGHSCIQNFDNVIRRVNMKKALVVTDTVLIQLKTTDNVTEQLTKADVSYNIFDGVLPNPTIAIVNKIMEAYKTNDCDGLISIGGGSAHDAAKAAALLLSNRKPIRKYQGLNVTKHKLLMPLICVNTTAGTGSEVTNVAVITDETTHFKMTLVDKNMLANITVNDSNLMLGLPHKATVYTGIDALTHAIEADLSLVNNDLVQAYSHQAMRTIFQTLPKVYADLQNAECREQMVYGEYLAGIAFNSASLGFIHSLSHAMSAVFNTPHGLANAILMPYVLDYELTNTNVVKKLAKIADYLGLNCGDALNDHEKAKSCVLSIVA
jgi:alcohol dehydrogenase